MLTIVLREMLGPAFSVAAGRIKGNGLMLALAGFGLGLAALVLASRHFFLLALVLLLTGWPFFAIAAEVSHRRKEIKGKMLPKLLQCVALAGFPYAFSLAMPENAVSATFLLFALTALFAAVFAFADDETRHDGPLGEIEILVVFALVAIVPEWFGPAAYVTGVLCFVAAGLRIDAALNAGK
jgi:hypothetical protein